MGQSNSNTNPGNNTTTPLPTTPPDVNDTRQRLLAIYSELFNGTAPPTNVLVAFFNQWDSIKAGFVSQIDLNTSGSSELTLISEVDGKLTQLKDLVEVLVDQGDTNYDPINNTLVELTETLLSIQNDIDALEDMGLTIDVSSIQTSIDTFNTTLVSITGGLNALVDKSTTVNGKPLTANITLNKSDIGLSAVENVAQLKSTAGDFNNEFSEIDTAMAGDAILIEDSGMSLDQIQYVKRYSSIDKIPQSAADTALLNQYVPKSTKINQKALTSDISLNKSDIGLGNVDNTSNVNKPVSNACQFRLNAKVDKLLSQAAMSSVGSASECQLIDVNAEGQITSLTTTPIALTPANVGLNAVSNVDGSLTTASNLQGTAGYTPRVGTIGNGLDMKSCVEYADYTLLNQKQSRIATPVDGNLISFTNVGRLQDAGLSLDDSPQQTSSTNIWSGVQVNSYIDSTLANLLRNVGGYDASTNAYPSSGGSGVAGAINRGDSWLVTQPGTLNTSINVAKGDSLIAIVNNPSQLDTDWIVVTYSNSYQTEDVANKEDTVLDNSTVKYPTTRLLTEYIDSALADKELKLPAGGTATQFIAGNKSLRNLDKNSVGLSNVSNVVHFPDANGSFTDSIQSNANPVSSDIMFVEDSSANYAKKKITLGSLPVSVETENLLNSKVIKASTTVNGNLLVANVTLSKTSIGLGAVSNTSPANKPTSVQMNTALNSKLNKLSLPITPGIVGGNSKTLQVVVNAKGQLVDVNELDISIPVNETSFVNLQNVDTTKQSNVLLTTSYSRAGAVELNDSGQDAFEKLQTQLNGKITSLDPFTPDGKLIVSNNNGQIMASNYTLDDSVISATTIPSAARTIQIIKSFKSDVFKMVGGFTPLGSYPVLGVDNGLITSGNFWIIDGAGMVGNKQVSTGDMLFATEDSPIQDNNKWCVVQGNIQGDTESVENKDTDTLDISLVKYPSMKAFMTYLNSKLDQLQDIIPVGTTADYLRADHTFNVLNKNAIGLGNVTNDAQLKSAPNDFNTFTESTTPSGSDVILIEDSTGIKYRSSLAALPTTSSTQTYDLTLKVDKTTTVNGVPLSTANTVITNDLISLENVDNVSDADKPVSTAQQAVIDLKVLNVRQVNGYALNADVTITKGDLGLGAVLNVADEDLPISTALQSALDNKYSTVAPGGVDGGIAVVTPNDNDLANSGIKLNDAGVSSVDVWSVDKVLNEVSTNIQSGTRYMGGYDASSTAYPSVGSGAGGSVIKGDIYTVTVAGVINTTVSVQVGDVIIANVDAPAQVDTNWLVLNENISYTPEDVLNKSITTVDNSTTSYPSNAALSNYLSTTTGVYSDKVSSPVAGNAVKLSVDGSAVNSGNAPVNSFNTTSMTELPSGSSVKAVLDTKINNVTGTLVNVVNNDLTLDRAVVLDGSGVTTVSNVTSTELAHLNGVTAAVQTTLDSKLTGINVVVANEAAMLALTGMSVDNIIIRADENYKLYRLTALPESTLSNWSSLGGTGGGSGGVEQAEIPAYDFSNFNYPGLKSYIEKLCAPYKHSEVFVELSDNGNVTMSDIGGSVYCPVRDRIYLVPNFVTGNAWFYVDCRTEQVVSYSGPAITSIYAQYDGVYSPTQKRIYLVPLRQAIQSQWYYIDCNTGTVVAYTHGVTAVESAYAGGVYSPTQNRIYFVPFDQGPQSQWHYIDCGTGSVVAYTHGVSAVSNAYSGGVYSPTQNRIYLVPFNQSSQSQWHYIDCTTGSVVAYTHGVTAVSSAYFGGVYSPTQNRIYLSPRNQGPQSQWHYIDCNTGSVVAYASINPAVNNAYDGGVFSPTQNRIYFVPSAQALQTLWHYIDCNTGNVVAYTRNISVILIQRCGSYNPINDTIYLGYVNTQKTLRIRCGTSRKASKQLMSSALFGS